MSTKNILFGAGAIFGTFILLFFIYKLVGTPPQTEFPEANKIRKTDSVKWVKKSKNILVEYSDFQCPACREFNSFLLDLEKTATPNAAFVFRHFPLYQIHPNSLMASYAAVAAGLQGKFWEMESMLYEKQADWSALTNPKEYFIKAAAGLKLDEVQFRNDIDSSSVKAQVQADLNEAVSMGINSTPTFFLNGKKINVATMEEFKNLLNSL